MVQLTMEEWIAAAKTVTQRAEAVEKSRCSYFNELRQRCFVGAAASEETARRWESMEVDAHALFEAKEIAVADLSYEDGRDFVERLQVIHDNGDPLTWHERLDRLFAEFKPKEVSQ